MTTTRERAMMRKSGDLLLVILAAILLVGAATVASADTSDFALFDGSNPANQPTAGAVCGANSSFTYHVAVANWGAAGEVRITFNDGDIIRFPIAPGASFAFSQAAGSKGGADRAVRVSNGGSGAQLAGSMSASGQGNPRCISCDADSPGDAGCDAIVSD
jgi:hypothetical protein